MSEPAKPIQTCERCGEWGCEPALHPEAGSELAMVATTGGLLGGTLVGLVALPRWLRRYFEPPDAPPGDPRRRLHQDRVATAVLSALAMAILALCALVVAGVEHVDRGPERAFAGLAGEAPPEGSELEEILRLVEHGSPAQAAVGMDQLLELAPELPAAAIDAVASTHERVGPAAGWGDDRSRALREALRRSDHAEAANGLAAAYAHIEDPVERGQTLVALGRCADPEALGRVIDAETERYRTPELAHYLNVGCVHHVAHELLALADAHPAERPGVYRALSEGCDFRPHEVRDGAGAAIAERWLALSSRSAAEQAAPATHWLAHALACADEELLDRALTTMPPAADEWTRAEVAIASYRRDRRSLDSLLQQATEDEALRRKLDEHYEGSAPWEDPAMAPPPEPTGFERFRQVLDHQRRLHEEGRR